MKLSPLWSAVGGFFAVPACVVVLLIWCVLILLLWPVVPFIFYFRRRGELREATE